ncbi:hypothetical protein [Aggregatilinea lenta]|uniref:hypothetical protein n=1 Tax=Aggregatilinea lenta TaxID=913108 RepID=UPI000E5A39DC|nr:hypothetical protein [Aggregatilinea lenta]
MFKNEAITICAGRWDAGAFHRALDVARCLHDASLWDGVSSLALCDPYALHDRLFGVRHEPIEALIPGVDYVIRPAKKPRDLDDLVLPGGAVVAAACSIPHVSGDPDRPAIPASTLGVVVDTLACKGSYVVEFCGIGTVAVWEKDLAVLDAGAVETLPRMDGSRLLQLFVAQQMVIRSQRAQLMQLQREIAEVCDAHAQIQQELTEQVDYEAARADGLQERLDGLVAELMEEGRAPVRPASLSQRG